MLQYIYLLVTGLIALLFTNYSEKYIQTQNQEKPLSANIIQREISKAKVVSQDTTRNCLRGQAEPILKKDIFPQSSFYLQADSITGIEILNWSYAEVFCFI